MPARKRGRDEMEAEEPVQEPTTLQKLRNMWQFANLAQYINLFGDAIKIDKDFDIEDLETECLMPQPSEKLAQIGLALLKHVSSHKGLTLDIFDEYTRRQFVAKAPDRNPFGIDEEPNKFNDFDIFTKIRVLQQLSLWTLNNPNSIRERMNATDGEQTQWRMEPTGWDSQDRALFILDDNRMYRRTDPPPPPPPKAKSKPKPKKSRSTRTSKRRKVSTPEPEEPEEEDMTMVEEPEEAEDDGLGGMKWECLCITLEDYQEYLSSIRKSRDPNEKILYKRIEEDVLPVIGKMAEEEARKQARKMKELETMQKLALAKRSSRISQRLEKQKEAEAEEAAERKRQAELAMAQAEQEKQKRIEEAHESRRMTREQRLREREAAKILKEEELRKLKEDEEKLNNNDARLSERHLKAMLKRRKEELERLNEEEDWFFDCEKCGMHGSKLDDGSGQVCCDKCNVWQHLKCHNIPEDQADKVDFICSSCKRKEEEAKQPKLPPLKLRLTSTSPSSREGKKASGHAPGSAPKQTAQPEQPRPRFEPAQTPMHHSSPTRPPPQSIMDGPSLSPRGQALGPPGIHRSEAAYGSPFINRINGSSPPRPYSSGQYNSSVPVANTANGLPASSPPRYQAPSSPSNNFSLSHSAQRNGSPFGVPNPFRTTQPPYSNSFGRPASASGLGNSFGSPVKHSPGPSPRPTNGGVPNAYNFTNSPHSSFPPSSHQRPSFSPTKNSSPPPHPPLQMSSPATASVRIVPSPSQMPAQVLPNPIPAPSKHDGARPVSSHSLSETPVLPPVKSFSPSTGPQILSPPKKKQSPAPERTIGVIPFNGNAG